MTPRAAHRSQAGPIHIPVYRDRPLTVTVDFAEKPKSKKTKLVGENPDVSLAA